MIDSIVYLVSNIFIIFLIYQFMGVFYIKKGIKRKTELLLYIGYYIVICLAHLIVQNPVVTLAVNVIALIVIVIFYNKKLSIYGIMSIACVYGTMFVAEMLVLLILGTENFDVGQEMKVSNYIITYSLLLFIYYLIILLSKRLKNIKNTKDIGLIYNITIFTIPIISGFLIISFLQIEDINRVLKYVMVFLLLLMNFIVFFLYDLLCKYFADNTSKIISERQNENYAKQIEYMKSIQDRVFRVEHDIKNHLKTIKQYITNKKNIEAEKYIDSIVFDTKVVKSIVISDNIVVDSALNNIVSQCDANGIKFNVNVEIPATLNVIKDVDLNSLLFNILDNAINACVKIEEGLREIKLSIKYEKTILNIVCENTFDGVVVYDEKNNPVTRHMNKKLHGFGLKIIRNILKKYDGIYEIKPVESKFVLAAMLYDN